MIVAQKTVRAASIIIIGLALYFAMAPLAAHNAGATVVAPQAAPSQTSGS